MRDGSAAESQTTCVPSEGTCPRELLSIRLMTTGCRQYGDMVTFAGEGDSYGSGERREAEDSFFVPLRSRRRCGRRAVPRVLPASSGKEKAAAEQDVPEGSAACSRMMRRIPTSRRRGPRGPASRRQGAAGSRGGRGHGQPRRELVQTVLIFYGQRNVDGVRAENGRAAYHAACRAYGAKG